MTIHVFDETQSSQFSEGDFSNPLQIVKNGTVSNTQTIRLYLNNNDNGGAPMHAYENVSVTPIPDSKIGANSLSGWWMKVLPGDNGVPSESDWDAVAPGESLIFNDDTHGSTFPADISYFYEFYVRIYIPAGAEVQQTRVVKLDIDSTQVP